MVYKKPEVVEIGEAVDTVQGQTFKSVLPVETRELVSTVPAYEADE
jgi:hypothetical protein